MTKQHNLNTVSLLAVILLTALVGIAPASSIETPINEIIPETGVLHN